MKVVKILAVLIAIGTAASAQYPLVPIDSIQCTLMPNGDSSYFARDTVTTGGLVIAGTGLFYAGAGVTFYLANPEGGPCSGIMAYNSQAQGFPELIPGDSILFNALVSEYTWNDPPVSHTELLIVPGSFQYRLYGMPEPPPYDVTAIEIDSTGGADSLGEQYESVFLKVNGLTVDTVINYTTTSVWVCHDSTGLCFVREASDSIPDSFRPDAGTEIDFVQGVIYHRFGAFHLQPRYMRDIRLAAGAPIVSARHWPPYPIVGDPVTFTATIVDDSGIEDARLYYRINLGSWTNLPMTECGINQYCFTLPSPQPNWNVDYYIVATDDSGNVTNEPYEAPSSFFEYRVQQPRVMSVTQARADLNADFVPDMRDSAVIVSGIVNTPNFSTDRTDFFMQADGAGINVYFDSSLINVNPGDSVTASGVVGQRYGKTQLVIYRSNRMTIHGPGTLPPPITVTCSDLGDINGEAYEGILVKVENVDIIEFPDPWPSLGFSATMTMVHGADTATLRIDRYTDIDGQPQPSPRATVTGVVGQYDLYDPFLSYYQLMPRYYTDFEWLSGVDENGANLPDEFSLNQNYPNPFNPSTIISFELPRPERVRIEIFNLMGQKVSTLINEELAAGPHQLEWNGKNLSNEAAPSGIYFYMMETDSFAESKKMMLVK